MKLIEQILRFIAPADCIVCGKEGDSKCVDCQKSTERLLSRCYRCYRLTTDSRTCQSCRSSSLLTHVWVVTSYNALAKKVIHSLKFKYSRDSAKTIAIQIYKTLPTLPESTIITHIPMATSRVRQRGFDQSALIACELSYIIGLPHVHALARLGQHRQVGASGSTRRQQLKGVFRVVSHDYSKDKKVLLIDDVTTMGSSLEEAAVTLKSAGVVMVAVAVYAQATR